MINKFSIVLFVYTVMHFIVIVAFLAKLTYVLAVYLIESYVAMEPFESRFHPFSSFSFYLKNKFTVISSVSCPWTQTNALLMK